MQEAMVAKHAAAEEEACDACPFADRIEPHLHLGEIRALESLARSHPSVQAQWCVVSVVEESVLRRVALPACVSGHLILHARDEPDTVLSGHFERAHRFIQKAHEQDKKVLVHCLAGISRSATIMAAHLILEHGIDDGEALLRIRRKRARIAPNQGFRGQLRHLAQSTLQEPVPPFATLDR